MILHWLWVVARQTLEMEPRWPGFFLMEKAIRSTMVWILLPWLLVELWGEAAIQKVLGLASDLVMMDDSMAE